MQSPIPESLCVFAVQQEMLVMVVRYVLVSLLLTFGLLGVLQGAERPIVRRVRVEGVRRMSEDRVRGWLVTRAGISLDSLLLRQDLRRILEGYRDAGYWQAAVAPPEVGLSEKGASVRFRVEEGRLTRVASVEVTGNRQIALDALLEAMASRPGTPLVSRHLEADMDALLRVYENRGYPYAALRPEVGIEPGKDLAQVRVAIEEGPFVRVDTIRFTGNRVTRAGVLLREMRLAPGEPYDQRRVDRALQALRRLPFLLEVRGATLEQEGNTGRWALVVAVREASATRVEGGLSYAPGPGGLTHALTGTFTLDFDNLLGTGRGGHVSWGRQGPAASDLNLRYRELWVLGHPLSAEVDLMVRQRPGYVENSVGAGLVLALSPDLGVRVGFRRGGVRPDSSGPRTVFPEPNLGAGRGHAVRPQGQSVEPEVGAFIPGPVQLRPGASGRQGTGPSAVCVGSDAFSAAGKTVCAGRRPPQRRGERGGPGCPRRASAAGGDDHDSGAPGGGISGGAGGLGQFRVADAAGAPVAGVSVLRSGLSGRSGGRRRASVSNRLWRGAKSGVPAGDDRTGLRVDEGGQPGTGEGARADGE